MKFKLKLLSISLMILLSVFTLSCELTLILDVENQTNQFLTMRVDGKTYFRVSPHSRARGGTTLTNPDRWLVEGINDNNEITFSKYYDHTELHDTTLKVQIPSNENQPYLPVEIENNIADRIEIYVNNAFIGWIQPGEKMIKKLFPPSFTNINILVIADPESVISGVTHTGPGRIIINHIFYRDELEENNWKLIITNP